MNLFDSHAHLTSPEVLPHLEGVLERAKIAGISHILNICTDPESLRQGILLRERCPYIFNAGATTPHDVATDGDAAFVEFEAAARAGRLKAIGETGLDYHYEHSPKPIQKEYLRRYLALAQTTSLPVIFHCRNAFDDLFPIVDEMYQGPAILHCFTGTMDEAKEVIRRGWYLSLSGIVTYKKSEALREVAQMVPLSQLLIETDTPYLAPQTRRGKPNEPAFLIETAQCVADVKGISLKEVALAISENGRKLNIF